MISHLNVVTGVDLTIRELADVRAISKGYKGAIQCDSCKPDGAYKKQLEVSRLAAQAWKARIPLAESLQSTVALLHQAFSKELVCL